MSTNTIRTSKIEILDNEGNVASEVTLSGGKAAIDSVPLDSGTYVFEGTLTQADILGMYASPIVAVPGKPGKTAILLGVQLKHNYSTLYYTDGGALTFATYDPATESVEETLMLVGSTIITEEDVETETYVQPSVYNLDAETGTAVGPLMDIPGVGICITNADAAFENGAEGNTLSYRIWCKYMDNFTEA
jgi:hypothetical protein